jgi:hypothetical protein
VNQSIQYENPANYVGWQNEHIGYLNWSDPADRSDLVTAADRSRYQDESEGITWQGYFLNGDLVPSLGWRKDKVTNYQTAAVTNQTDGHHEPGLPGQPCLAHGRPGHEQDLGRSLPLPEGAHVQASRRHDP